jgi:PTH2 family peptidyl-tRNA hydrolase
MSDDPIKQVLVIRRDLNMRKGKMIAQGAHAAMSFLLGEGALDESNNSYTLITKLSEAAYHWLQGKFTKIVVSAASEAELQALIDKAEEAGIPVYPITDSGATEFHGVPTLTCAAFGPEHASKLDPITGHLPLL